MKKYYNVEMTEEEITKLTIFMLQHLPKLIDYAETYKELKEEYKGQPQAIVFSNNEEYYKEMFNILSEVKERIDNIPF